MSFATATPESDFSRALKVYLNAKAALNAYERETYLPASYEAEAAGPGRSAAFERLEPIQDHFNELCGITTHAADALMLIPSPDIAALADKLTVAADEDSFNARDDAERFLAAVRDDARRLAGKSVQ